MRKIISFAFSEASAFLSPSRLIEEGRCANVTRRWVRDAMAAMRRSVLRRADVRHVTDGEVAGFWPPDAEVKFRKHAQGHLAG
jgi:hypothetical protein